MYCGTAWRARCARPDGAHRRSRAILTCAQKTAGWLVEQITDHRKPTAAETCEIFESHWRQTSDFRSRDALPQNLYQRRLAEIGRACRRLRDLLWSHEVLGPPSSYELPVGDAVLTGEYMVLRSPRRKRRAYAVYLRYRGIKIRPVIPDIISFARWLDVQHRWRATAPRSWRIEGLGVLHYWVNQDLAAEHRPDPEVAAQTVAGAVGVFTGKPFPVPRGSFPLLPHPRLQSPPGPPFG